MQGRHMKEQITKLFSGSEQGHALPPECECNMSPVHISEIHKHKLTFMHELCQRLHTLLVYLLNWYSHCWVQTDWTFPLTRYQCLLDIAML